MMIKLISKGLLLIFLFFLTWLVLAQFDWMHIFKVKKVTDQTEEKLGELYWDIFKRSEKEITDPFVVSTIDSIVHKICTANGIDTNLIKVHLFDKAEVNAFALPNGHLLLYSGLMLEADNPEELSGVLAHEIAHIQLNHVMKKLVKEVGLSVLISMATGNGGAEIMKETAKLLTSSAYDRSLEKEADIKAIDYLANAKIKPEAFADFLYKLSADEHDAMKYLAWINTHPETKERAATIIAHSSNKLTTYEPVLSAATWEKLKEQLRE
ncbi:MAG: M48 family metallopeptidase [Bacteroidetes bacterium]|jgi:predicted Zn-dependent protease|nr:M48 family metallopeptidase [Bacteroidota bacterium]